MLTKVKNTPIAAGYSRFPPCCVFWKIKNAIEVLPTNPPLFVQYRVHIRKEADKGAYGSTSETTAVSTFAGVNANGIRYDFSMEALVVGKRYQHYWLEKNGKRKSFKNFKQFVKLYPEGNAEARFKIRGVKKIFFYCNRDGLFFTDVVKGIDDKESGYDNYRERRALEKAAKMLFG